MRTAGKMRREEIRALSKYEWSGELNLDTGLFYHELIQRIRQTHDKYPPSPKTIAYLLDETIEEELED